MRSTKIRRRNRMFRKRRVAPVIGKILLWLLVIPAAIGGYYLAQYLATRPGGEPAISPSVSEPTGTTVPSTTVLPDGTTPDDAPDTTPMWQDMRAVYLPSQALFNPLTWDTTLRAAADAGYNTVIVDVKDVDGTLWYRSATELAAMARAVAEQALPLTALQQLGAEWQSTYGLTLVPRLFAFRDNTAPRYLENARVSVEGNSGAVWYDNAPAKGGRRWLNPYASEAQEYILGLAQELHNAGFSQLMLDGVQFPAQESRACYGSAEQTATPRGQVLAGFVAAMNNTVGQNGWMLTVTAESTVGETTGVYGANPVTFGARAVCPWALPGDMGSRLELGDEKVPRPKERPYEAATLLFGQLKARLQLIDTAPAVVPWLQADYPPEEVAAQLRALREQFGDRAPYILYHPEGTYTF